MGTPFEELTGTPEMRELDRSMQEVLVAEGAGREAVAASDDAAETVAQIPYSGFEEPSAATRPASDRKEFYKGDFWNRPA